MDVKNLIEAAEYCLTHDGCSGCAQHKEFADGMRCSSFGSVSILTLRDHYAAREKAIFDGLREWAEKSRCEMYGPLRQDVVLLNELLAKLDEMEADNG